MLAFHHCDKVPKVISLQGKVYFGSPFQKFQFMIAWTHCFRPEVAEHHGEVHMVEEAVHLMVTEK